MIIKILGTGCPKCKTLEARIAELTAADGINCEIEKITDLNEIMNYGVMMTPGLVINDQLKSAGNVPGEKQLLEWLKED